MTKAQRGIIEDVIETANRGPSLRDLQSKTIPGAEQAARIWAQSWIVGPLQAILDNEDGKVSAADLRRYYHAA
jgi:hypothetical protein